MSPQSILLESVHIANPCHVPWDAMAGDDRVRFCDQCRLNVYDLSAMTGEEAEDFLRRREGRTCLRLFRRADGTVLTRDCTVGQGMGRRKIARIARLFLGVLFFTLMVALAVLWDLERGTTRLGSQPDRWASLRSHAPFRALLDWLDPLPPPPPSCEVGW
jgi:hypothetical protein